MPATRLMLVILALASASAGFAADAPLFRHDETLQVVLEFPLRALLKQKESKSTVSGTLRYVDPDGTSIALDVGVSTRGNSRLEQCRYPPLGINFKKHQVADTLFAGQNKLKLVTLCRDTRDYRRYLYQEYALYQAYNLLSDYSFRVRMLDVVYREPDGRQPKDALPAFFIESDHEVATRLDMTRVGSRLIEVSRLEAMHLSILTLFQFMIGNTDWSVQKGPGSEDCCHNGKVIGPPDARAPLFVIPYDFDQSGLINASYALPSESLPIRSVRQRLYRGFCSTNSLLDTTIELFNERRSGIEEVLADQSAGRSAGKAALNYLDGFFLIVNDPKKKKKQLLDRCRSAATLPAT